MGPSVLQAWAARRQPRGIKATAIWTEQRAARLACRLCLLFWLLVPAAGCTTGPKSLEYTEVSGTVFYKGKPLPGGRVTFVTVQAGGGWDTHANNFKGLKDSLLPKYDQALTALVSDLCDRGLQDDVLVMALGEFGRTPKINQQRGRDHYPSAWSTVLAGGGIKGGQVIGRTSADGMTVEERPVAVPDLLATISKALAIDPMKWNMSNVGRPIRIADKSAQPIQEVLA